MTDTRDLLQEALAIGMDALATQDEEGSTIRNRDKWAQAVHLVCKALWESHIANRVDDCTCGTGGHPQACVFHPWGMELHCATIQYADVEDEFADAQAQIEVLRAELSDLRKSHRVALVALDHTRGKVGNGCSACDTARAQLAKIRANREKNIEKPTPPWDLASALHGRVHKDLGPARVVKILTCNDKIKKKDEHNV